MAHSHLLLIAVVTLLASLPSEARIRNCTGRCECKEKVDHDGLYANCTLRYFKELATYILRPADVKTLEILLSEDIETVPNGSFKNFTNLRELDLSHNSIAVIEEGAFSNLSYLQRLDLSSNQLAKWEGNWTNEVPQLVFLDISGNANLALPAGLLRRRKLKEIRGVTWNEQCSNCTLMRNYTLEHGDLNNEDVNITTARLVNGDYIVGKKVNCRVNRLVVSQHLVKYAEHGFFPLCLKEKNSACFRSEVQVTPVHRCWDLDNKILNVVFFISPIALVLNLTVLLVSLTTRVLRRNVTMLLTANMAASDILVSVYSVILVTTRKMTYVEYLVILEDLCNAIGFIWVTGQIVSIKTSLFLTIERHLAIVYCMEPSIRMTRRTAVILVVFIWCLGVAIAVLPLVNISVYTSNTYCIPIRPIKDIPHSYEMSIALSLWGMVLYLTTVPLYIKTFISIKKTSQRAGVNRDGLVAKKIAILVMSNMLFFFLPIVIAFLWLTTNLKETMSPQSREILTGVIPTLLFSFNAFINPLLYAFRAEKFQRAIKMRIETICLGKPRTTSWAHSYSNYAVSEKKRHCTLPPSSKQCGDALGSKVDDAVADSRI
ncbi:probable glycoprotein hormone G-protein coupled receptor [Montipora foliosa]|uniref:probable glycoprotein hormone G-protein coupled receptor n=1 Tax=Montipora foliosa TaxID=591990 RepID=UPI0035F16DDD